LTALILTHPKFHVILVKQLQINR